MIEVNENKNNILPDEGQSNIPSYLNLFALINESKILNNNNRDSNIEALRKI